jgi:flagellar biosynthesis/type III secretory pathway protein FliH
MQILTKGTMIATVIVSGATAVTSIVVSAREKKKSGKLLSEMCDAYEELSKKNADMSKTIEANNAFMSRAENELTERAKNIRELSRDKVSLEGKLTIEKNISKTSFNNGFSAGDEAGYARGYETGFKEGKKAGVKESKKIDKETTDSTAIPGKERKKRESKSTESKNVAGEETLGK